MADCVNKVSANISYDCSSQGRARGGIETTAVLINRSDIDLTALTQDGPTVTNLSLKTGAKGFKIDWIKQLGNTASDFTPNDSGLDTYSQSFACRVFGQSADDAERIKELGSGEFVVVVESKYKGLANADAYKVFGIENGLRKSEGTFTSAENDGSYLFTLSSVEGFGETYPWQVLLETSYTATKTKFDAAFASV